jgi:hypothetical protein
MFEMLQKTRMTLQQIVEGLDPGVLEPRFATKLLECFSEIERIAGAGKTIAAGRVASSGAWKDSGDRSPAHFVARTTGSTVGGAVGLLETARRLPELPATDRALREGKLSEAQANQIASAAGACPSLERDLLEVAGKLPVSGLRQHCLKLRASSGTDEIARYEAIRKGRYLRHWSDPDGSFRLDARLTPDAGAVVVSALEPLKDRIFHEARKLGVRETYNAYAADALVRLAQDGASARASGVASGSSSRRRAMIHVRVDHSALVRGHAAPGETCDLPGIGPIPVATARSLAEDAYLSVILTDGFDVKAVCHSNRYIPSHLLTALQARDPGCVVPGCIVTDHLEIDHIHPVHEGGLTKLDNLARLCPWHHRLKTHHRYRLSGGPGAWWFEEPKKPEHAGARAP